MRFLSTRAKAAPVSFSEAVRHGAAPDGGLYLPETAQRADPEAYRPGQALAPFAANMLTPFVQGDRLEPALGAICEEAFSFDVPIVTPDPSRPALRALELFHGPTGAFKDFGARFLMACFDRLGDEAEPLTVLAATSGDTGGAVGCAAEGRTAVRAMILYPQGRVSAFQEHQLTCWRAPVSAAKVEGDFDTCQSLVKAAFRDDAMRAGHRLTSANSINIARLLPQAAYLAHAATEVETETGKAPGLIIPTGNLGHAFAALYARRLGYPIGPVLIATNANATLSEWSKTGRYEPRASIATIANAMDVGAPSNFERLAALEGELGPVGVMLADDDVIRRRIKSEHERCGYVWCPHSAIAAEAFERLPEARRTERIWLAAATAHPFKFADIVEPLISETITPSAPLAAVLERPASARIMPATLSALDAALNAA
ncbi:MAG: threonine synthase [Pseudomonadota bacterium]